MTDPSAAPLEATLRRLKAERDEADARYNDALTALDRSMVVPGPLPQPPSPLDEHQITPLNEAWNILPAAPVGSRFQRRLTRVIWSVVAPYFERQLTFNSRVVDHINRNVATGREAHRAADATVATLRVHLEGLAVFHARLLLYLQQITGYVDTKDRDSAGGALVLNASLSGLAENVAKHRESVSARDRRNDARLDGASAACEELRSMIAVAQQAVLTLKREYEGLAQGTRDSGQGTRDKGQGTADTGQGNGAFAPALDAYKYVGFEDQFRGSRETIRARFESYLPFFAADAHGQPQTGTRAADVLDVGCGRGEFLQLLAAHGIPARGIDLNHEMVEGCLARALNVTEADAVGYLSSVADASLGGIFAAQVVEHLQPAYLLRFLELAYHTLRPGGRLVLETLNPACWVAFFESYLRDITHVWPLHPDTLKYLVTASGFTRVRVEFRSPVPPQDRLQPIAVPAAAGVTLSDLADAFNANVEKLNARMFTDMDYAIIAER